MGEQDGEESLPGAGHAEPAADLDRDGTQPGVGMVHELEQPVVDGREIEAECSRMGVEARDEARALLGVAVVNPRGQLRNGGRVVPAGEQQEADYAPCQREFRRAGQPRAK